MANDNVIALDSIGIKITNRGEWLPQKWNVQKRISQDTHSSCRYQEKEDCTTKSQMKKYMMMSHLLHPET